MQYVLLVKCTDGSVRKVEQEAATPLAARSQAESHLMYYQGTGIAEVLGVAEAPATAAA